MEWIKGRRLGPAYGNGRVKGSFFPMINSRGKEHRPFTLYSDGRMEIWFASIKQMQPFDNEQNLLELLSRLNLITGVNLEQESIKRYPGIRLTVFKGDQIINHFFSVFDWVFKKSDQPSQNSLCTIKTPNSAIIISTPPKYFFSTGAATILSPLRRS
jgi:hypothetical protein